MAKSLLELGVNTGQWDAGLKKAQSALNNFVQANGGLQNALAKDDQEIQTFVQMMGKMESTATTAKGKMNDYKRSIEVLTEQYKLLSAAQQKGVEGMTYMKSIDQITVKYRAAAAEVQKLNASLNVSNVAGGGGLGIGASIGSAFKMLGPAALAADGVMAAMNGLKSAISDMVSVNMQFEQASANLAAVMGKTRDQTTALTEQAKQLGATTQYTAVQITDLQTNLARLGFTESEILSSTKAVQALATATGAGLGDAANLAGAALRGFGMNAAEMERVASVLAVSTTKSALSFEKLSTAVPIVAPVAKQFGFTIEDTVTLLAKLSDAGMDASSAATATRNIFLKMANDSGKLATALGRPVHSVEEFGEALKEMRERGMSLSDILNMVGVRSTAAFAVFADNADTLKDFKQSITDCSDAMHDMESTQLNTLQGSVTIMKSAWEGLMLTFSDSNGILKSTTDALTSLLQAWTNWRKRQQGGEGANGLYVQGVTDEQKKMLQTQVEEKRAAGATDESLQRGAEKRIALLKKEDEEMTDLLKKWEKAGKLGWGSEEVVALTPEVQSKFGVSGYAIDYAEQMRQQIANVRDRISQQEYVLGLVTPTTTVDNPEKDKQKQAEQVAILRAQYEAEEKQQIAALDRMAMQEEDYEAKVYEIRRASMEKIAALYNEDTAEHARALARISQLEIEYQGKQMRLASQKERAENRYPVLTGVGGYSQEGISQLRQEIQNALKSVQIGSDEYLLQADRLVDLSTFENLLKTAMKNGLTIDPMYLENLFDQIDLGVDISDEAWQQLVNDINEKLKELNLPPIELNVKTGAVATATADASKLSSEWVQAAQAVSAFGNALQSVEDPTAKIAGIIAEAIASVAAGAGGAIAKAGTEGEAWSWVAFALTATATMVSTISAIRNATKFEHGGMVGGNRFQGDNIVARLNSGEGVLTAKGVGNAAMLEGIARSRGGESNGPSYVTGENIVLGVNNYLGRSGQGEIVTTGMLRRAGINL
ncbi:MAG: phage tail tape measure protein [Prevotella sp.]|nr:phage tail tape measure protein [Prevotella sp.]MBR3858522.1 phage tail tape measure protein [Bacteroidaceae bacterium]